MARSKSAGRSVQKLWRFLPLVLFMNAFSSLVNFRKLWRGNKETGRSLEFKALLQCISCNIKERRAWLKWVRTPVNAGKRLTTQGTIYSTSRSKATHLGALTHLELCLVLELIFFLMSGVRFVTELKMGISFAPVVVPFFRLGNIILPGFKWVFRPPINQVLPPDLSFIYSQNGVFVSQWVNLIWQEIIHNST